MEQGHVMQAAVFPRMAPPTSPKIDCPLSHELLARAAAQKGVYDVTKRVGCKAPCHSLRRASRLGTARLGTARHGTARHGTARHGTARSHLSRPQHVTVDRTARFYVSRHAAFVRKVCVWGARVNTQLHPHVTVDKGRTYVTKGYR